MNVLILNGSPHTGGTSALMIDEFRRGAEESGHEVSIFNCNGADIHPCIACYACRKGDNGCVFKDDMVKVEGLLDAADVVVFSTPLYYFGISAQLKVLIDRFFARNEHWKSSDMKAVMMMTCGDTGEWATNAIKSHFETICYYLNWENAGHMFAEGCYEREDIEKSDYPKQAYEFGRDI